MKLTYTSVLAVLLLCAWTDSEAYENCEKRFLENAIDSHLIFPASVEEPDNMEEVRRPKKKKKKEAKLAHEATINSLLAEAQKHLRTPYRYGGNSPSQGFDCSGYVKYIYQKYGVDLPRVSKEQARKGQKIKRKDASPGDLIYFGPRKSKITHVGIVTSEKGESLSMIHASSSNGVEIAYIDGVKYWEKRVQGFRRLLEP